VFRLVMTGSCLASCLLGIHLNAMMLDQVIAMEIVSRQGSIACLSSKNCMKAGRFHPIEPGSRPRHVSAGAFGGMEPSGLNSSDLPGASGVPTASGPIAAHNSRRNRKRPGRRQRRRDRASPSRHAIHRANRGRPRRRLRSAPARPHPTKLRQLQQARVCVTWSSPRGSALSAPSVNFCPVTLPNRPGARSIEAYL
jgi:hypothetical protein